MRVLGGKRHGVSVSSLGISRGLQGTIAHTLRLSLTELDICPPAPLCHWLKVTGGEPMTTGTEMFSGS